MILINLLPHREEKRKRRKAAYFTALGVSALVGVAVVGVWYGMLDQMQSAQIERNAFLDAENKKLDAQIKDIAERFSNGVLQAFHEAFPEMASVRALDTAPWFTLAAMQGIALDRIILEDDPRVDIGLQVLKGIGGRFLVPRK